MRTLDYTNAFKRDYKKVKATPKHKDIDSLLNFILVNLSQDSLLPQNIMIMP